jgi:DNA-binding protein
LWERLLTGLWHDRVEFSLRGRFLSEAVDLADLVRISHMIDITVFYVPSAAVKFDLQVGCRMGTSREPSINLIDGTI